MRTIYKDAISAGIMESNGSEMEDGVELWGGLQPSRQPARSPVISTVV